MVTRDKGTQLTNKALCHCGPSQWRSEKYTHDIWRLLKHSPGQFGHETINTIDLVQKLLFQGTWTLLQMHEILLLSYRLSKTSIRKFLKYKDKFEIVKIDNC